MSKDRRIKEILIIDERLAKESDYDMQQLLRKKKKKIMRTLVKEKLKQYNDE